jgi:hypothetical protein
MCRSPSPQPSPRRSPRPAGARVAALATGAALLIADGAAAWLAAGHRQVALDAVAAVSPELPAFFRAGGAAVGHAAIDPDVWRNRDTPALADREAPEHYLDLELLRGAELPAERDDYLRLLGWLRVSPSKAGALPYAIVEGSERLALCFAEHRRWTSDETIRAKCLLAAGWLAHYLGDLTQPLHTTIHHDGRVRGRGDSPRTGIHRRVDALLDADGGARVAPLAVDDLWSSLGRELLASHRLVDEVYRLEPRLGGDRRRRDPELAAFAEERRQAAVRLTAGVFEWCWRRSAAIELPDWLRR